MKPRIFTLIAMLAALPLLLKAQLKQDDPVLFTVDNTPVHLSEFKYIYTKTNGQTADFSKKSLQEYLDLYVKFKLKVQKAKEMRLDTIPSLQTELAGYRKQLADSYLIDREVTDKLLKELYARIQQDIDVSHILVTIGTPNTVPTPADTLAAYNKIMEIKKRLDKGEDFASVAREASEDPSAKDNGGNIGWLVAPLPNTFYDFENAIYTLAIGKASAPIRTRLGYHLLNVNQRRPARGEIEVAHILARAVNGNFDAAKTKIDAIYAELEMPGANFEQVATEKSDDEITKARGGYLGIFGIGRYERGFEDAAFAIEKDGQFSPPIRTSIGWHIIKRITKRSIQPFDVEKSRLEAKIKQDSRFEQARVAMLERIRKDNNFKEDQAALQAFIVAQDSAEFFTFKWKGIEADSGKILFTLGKDTKASIGEFADFLARSSNRRIRLKDEGVTAAINSLYPEFVNDVCLRFEESQLEVKYPEFKALMREYEEGILLFEATKIIVWDKASQDTIGLEKFYQKEKERYQWAERAVITTFKVTASARGINNDIRNYTVTHTPEEVLAKFNTKDTVIVSIEEKTMERKPGVNTVWKENEVSRPQLNRDGTTVFEKVMKVIPPGIKTLKEARGYVIADYQDYLEQEWVGQLRKIYKININQKVLDSLIKA
ncbi:MAG: peptidylprolyl isomerase [Saprospiraceae bacterium]|nr:peptidylprolyl isomerase [Saprospiraceae bacterium]